MRREVLLDDYDAAQVAAAEELYKRRKSGFVPGLGGLVNELSKVSDHRKVEGVISGWDN
ncbi:hypothetical protein IPM62_05610 [Candidatus Woesebacteria bacterium]|nr:MAG: hypothetical protein IPM62_05610 [Candidatus Woesebacteria bacterium]